ncbi:MAG TPA: alkane 1-monooxygenase [Citreicella sp.]|nr:alkane 1-monooxygenase [Citreicella sp.]
MTAIRYSLLDLSPIAEGGTAAEALANTVELARHAEDLGYNRFWLAEHHNMPGIASAATAVVIGQVAAATRTIRVGAGGIMLPNHAPLMIAEQFGTLATLFPGRIDLGLGRAPGSDQVTAMALRRNFSGPDRFPDDVVELIGFFQDPQAGQAVRAIPGEGTQVPVWMLGSSLYGAQLAAHLGLPYAFASHFAPDALEDAAAIYRRNFRPGLTEAPHFMLALNVWAADTEDEAVRLRTSQQQGFLNLRRGRPGPLPKPVDDIREVASTPELAMVDRALAVSATGTPGQVADQIAGWVDRLRPDELILTGMIHDPQARRHSFRLAADVLRAA